jgi:hypothetical protein
MNERFTLNSELVRAWLDKESRKKSYLSRQLGISDSLRDLMLGSGHIPKERTLQKLAALMGVEVKTLLLPKTDAKRAS